MKQNAAVGPYGTLGYPIEISRKGEYFAQLLWPTSMRPSTSPLLRDFWFVAHLEITHE
jgi:hypothetical protein